MLSSDIPLSPLRCVTLRRKNNQLGSCPTLEVAAEANDEHMRQTPWPAWSPPGSCNLSKNKAAIQEAVTRLLMRKDEGSKRADQGQDAMWKENGNHLSTMEN